MQNAISAILLDLDGTLVDSAPELARAVNAALRAMGRGRLGIAEIRAMIGNGLPTLTIRALEATGGLPEEGAVERIVERVRRIYDTMPPPRVYDGVGDTLALWHQAGLKLVICTNKPESSARRLVAALGFDRFIDVLAGGDTYFHRKPHPDHLLRPLLELGLKPAAAVMVGDSHIDASAARDAGIPFVAVGYGYANAPAETLAAARTVDRFADVTDAVVQLAGERGLAFPLPRAV